MSYLKFILGLFGLCGQPDPFHMPIGLWLDMRANHPELKTRDQWADYLVDECGSSYGEAYTSLPKHRFDSADNVLAGQVS